MSTAPKPTFFEEVESGKDNADYVVALQNIATKLVVCAIPNDGVTTQDPKAIVAKKDNDGVPFNNQRWNIIITNKGKKYCKIQSAEYSTYAWVGETPKNGSNVIQEANPSSAKTWQLVQGDEKDHFMITPVGDGNKHLYWTQIPSDDPGFPLVMLRDDKGSNSRWEFQLLE